MESGQCTQLWLPYRNLDVGTTGAVVKAAPGEIGGWFISNSNSSSGMFLKIYDKATAATSSDTPKITIYIPASGAANLLGNSGIDFQLGISIRATTGVADNDTGAPSANNVIANIFYQ